MIKKEDISNFFNLEAEAAKKSWEALMKLPINDRIRKRKAIKDVFLDRGYREMSDENFVLLKVSMGVNLADFKEGEGLLLHKEGTSIGIKCALNSFIGDEGIILEVFPPKMPANLEDYFDVPLILDRDLVDLRDSVYYSFLSSLNNDPDFWEHCLLNDPHSPKIEDRDKSEEALDDVFQIELLPAQREAIVNSLAANDYYLIQGPPGTGKSFVLSLIIFLEIVVKFHKIVIIGPNHMAINNTLQQVYDRFAPLKDVIPMPLVAKVGQSYNRPLLKDEEGNFLVDNVNYLNVPYVNSTELPGVIGITPHSLYSRRGRGLKCDTLIIDEAGQMTIPLALMGMIKAEKVILAGDHKQLPPIITSEEVPDYMQKSAFEALMTDDNYTLLDTSFRMCEPLCEYVSDLFYDSKVKAKKQGCGDMVICADPLYSFDKPVVIHQVEDNGCQASDKEAEYIVNTIVGFLKEGVPAKEIAVLAPFRAQAATIRRGFRKCKDISEEDKSKLVADTVDKMQGQEREVIIYSFTAGDPDYISEMADFLYKPNKLNVAFSRAKSKLIIVGSFDKILENAGDGFPHIKSMLNHKNVTKV